MKFIVAFFIMIAMLNSVNSCAEDLQTASPLSGHSFILNKQPKDRIMDEAQSSTLHLFQQKIVQLFTVTKQVRPIVTLKETIDTQSIVPKINLESSGSEQKSATKEKNADQSNLANKDKLKTAIHKEIVTQAHIVTNESKKVQDKTLVTQTPIIKTPIKTNKDRMTHSSAQEKITNSQIAVMKNHAQTNSKTKILMPQLAKKRVPSSIVTKDDVKHDVNVNDKFMQNETKLLFLPEDEVVLGKLSQDSRNEQIDYYTYVALFQREQSYNSRAVKRLHIDSFISNIDLSKNDL
jgi:hypothetical protein